MKGTLAGLSTVVIWSLSVLLAAHVNRLPPLQLTAMTWVVACILLIGWFLARQEKIFDHFYRPVKDYLFLISGMGVYSAIFYMGFKYAPAFEANALNFLWPIFLMGFICFFQKRPVTIYMAAGTILGFLGCIMLFLPQSGGRFFETFGIGHFLSIVGAVIWALYSALAKGKEYPIGFLIPVFLISGIATYAVHVAVEEPMMPTAGEWMSIGMIGFIRIGYVFWDYGMRHGDQILITSASYLTPLFSAIVLAMGGFGAESASVALAAAFIIAGCLLVNAEQFKILYKRWRP